MNTFYQAVEEAKKMPFPSIKDEVVRSIGYVPDDMKAWCFEHGYSTAYWVSEYCDWRTKHQWACLMVHLLKLA